MGKETYQRAMEAALHFKMIMEANYRQLDRELSERLVKLRIEASFLKTVILCGQQNISLHGHREDSKCG